MQINDAIGLTLLQIAGSDHKAGDAARDRQRKRKTITGRNEFPGQVEKDRWRGQTKQELGEGEAHGSLFDRKFQKVAAGKRRKRDGQECQGQQNRQGGHDRHGLLGGFKARGAED